MANAKTATLSFRIDPGLKEALRTAAKLEHRSIANMVEVMIREYCGRMDVCIPDAGADGREGQTVMPNQQIMQQTKKNA